MEDVINANFPNHRIRGCSFVDDSGSFAAPTIGTVYIDQLQCYYRAWGNASDGGALGSAF